MPNPVQKFFTLIGVLKYGIILSLLLIYLPLTAVFKGAPGHDITGNMFVELPVVGVLVAMMFLLAVAWSIMFTEGLIVNGNEGRFPESEAVDKNQSQAALKFSKRRRVYRRMEEIEKTPSPHIPAWADVFFAVPVTGWQFLAFTVVLAGPSFAVIVWRADRPVLAFFTALLAFAIDYVVFILLCTPAALLDTGDPPLRGFPLAEKIWSAFGYRRGEAALPTRAYRFSFWLRRYITRAVNKFHLKYLIDENTQFVYPIHFLTIMLAIALLVFWIVFDGVAYPGGAFEVESAPVVYVYASLLLFVWLFAGLNFHLGRLRISSIAALLLFVLIGYGIFDVDHDYGVRPQEARLPRLTPVETVENGKGGENLVVIASAGGGIWAAGWTALALEKFVGQRPELLREIRLLSTVSGGSVGAAHYVYGLLKDRQYQQQGKLGRDTLRDVRVKAVSSSLEATAYGVAFRDFPRLITGGIYHPTLDRGDLLEREWARIAAGTVAASAENAAEREYLADKGSEDEGKCWAEKNCDFLDLREAIAAGAVPAVIFNATVMEAGRKVMITPIDFEPNGEGHRRGETLAEFLFTDPKTGASPRADLPLWTAARLSATFSFVSPAVRTDVSDKGKSETRTVWRQHIVDGGYYDNFGIASALDWLQPVLEARRDGKPGLNFSRVLIVQLRGFAEKAAGEIKPSRGAKAALIGPLDALFNIREGVAVSRNLIDVDRFVTYWNRQLAGKVKLASVDFAPDTKETAGPLSWHLSKADIKNLQQSWGDGDGSAGWKPGIRKSWCQAARFLGHTVGPECTDP